MNINTNNYSILEIIGMLDRKELIVNPDYQRGSGIWPDGPSSYFIDTRLEGYPFPKIYMYECMDRSTRGIRKEIVDGQQRIKTIVRFHEDGLSLQGESKYAGKRFSDLDEEIQNQFVSYTVSVDVIRNATRAEILQMRSEEHTSELQSLLRISYAVFCLQKKNTKTSNVYLNAKTQQTGNEKSTTPTHKP